MKVKGVTITFIRLWLYESKNKWLYEIKVMQASSHPLLLCMCPSHRINKVDTVVDRVMGVALPQKRSQPGVGPPLIRIYNRARTAWEKIVKSCVWFLHTSGLLTECIV